MELKGRPGKILIPPETIPNINDLVEVENLREFVVAPVLEYPSVAFWMTIPYKFSYEINNAKHSNIYSLYSRSCIYFIWPGNFVYKHNACLPAHTI
jgi:hypothetical protein